MEQRTVLIAEDDPAMRETLLLQFEAEGFEPVTVENGLELVEAMYSMVPPVAIVTDVHMEGMNGAEALRKLLATGLNLPPVFIITSFPERVTLELATTLGCLRVFEKPFDLDELTDAIRGLPVTPRPGRTGDDSSARVLLVEDNAGDAMLAEEAFAQVGQAVAIDRVADGAECLAFLRGDGRHAGRQYPDLVLLDLNMPRMDGRECLTRIRADERLAHVPVIIMTTSSAEEDMRAMRELQCSAYFVKPLDVDRFFGLIKGISDFWLAR